MSVRLQFSTENAFDSAVIRWYTLSSVSHVDFVMDNGTLLGARTDGGVLDREPNYARFSHVIRAEVDCLDDVRNKVYAFAVCQLGKPYDWRSIEAMALPWTNLRERQAWFCSELVAAAFESAGYPLVNAMKAGNRITPQDVLESVRVRVVK